LGFVAGGSVGDAAIDRLRTRQCPRAAYSMIHKREQGVAYSSPLRMSRIARRRSLNTAAGITFGAFDAT
jgi:hypothetical protein